MGSWRRYSPSRVFGLLLIFIPIGGCGLADQIIYLNAAPREVPYSNTNHSCTAWAWSLEGLLFCLINKVIIVCVSLYCNISFIFFTLIERPLLSWTAIWLRL